MTNDECDRMLREFLKARPDLAKHVSFDPSIGPLISNEAIPQFALWATAEGYAPVNAFSKSLDLQQAVRDRFKDLPRQVPGEVRLWTEAGHDVHSVLAVRIQSGITDAQALDLMRNMKAHREAVATGHVVCTFDGYADDGRELNDIPEVRECCRRLVASGFVSYLDFSTQFPPGQSEVVRAGLGAAEVYLIGQNRFRPGLPATKGLFAEVASVVKRSNVRADARLGPLVPPAVHPPANQ